MDEIFFILFFIFIFKSSVHLYLHTNHISNAHWPPAARALSFVNKLYKCAKITAFSAEMFDCLKQYFITI